MSNGFFVHNLGCKVNRVESDTICAQLMTRGAHLVTRDAADVIIINTCTVTSEADAKTRKAIRQALAAEQHPMVVVTGCSTAINADTLSSLGLRVVIEPDRSTALERAFTLLRRKQDPDNTLGFHAIPYVTRSGESFNTRVGIKIQDGCDERCSFCIVSTARGPARSLAVRDILAEVELAVHAGARELIFTGVNLGSYQSDSGFNLTELLHLILEKYSGVRIRLSSIEPLDVGDDLLALIASSQGRICAHLHMPLQSGSDRILKSMNRPYTSSQYEALVQKAFYLLPRLAITTDVIVGFPDESDEDFEQTLDMCRRVGFSRIHVFKFSKRPGTAASDMPGQIPAPIKAIRSKQLIELAHQLATHDAARRIDMTEQVLVERAGRGTSESYHPVELSSSHKPGELIPLTFIANKEATLIEKR